MKALGQMGKVRTIRLLHNFFNSNRQYYVSQVQLDTSFHSPSRYNEMADKFDETTQVLHTFLSEAFHLIVAQKELAQFLERQQAQVRTIPASLRLPFSH
jgi:hypothetical protein